MKQRAQVSVAAIAQVFKMLGDKPRLHILMLLASIGELNVTTLCRAIGQSQPATSRHLALLRMAGLVNCRRDGRQTLYSVCSDIVRRVLTIAQSSPHQGRTTRR